MSSLGSFAFPEGIRGFTLLEAIVAMVVFTMGALALYAWMATNTITLGRIAERRESAAIRASALDAMQTLNPMLTPQGQRRIGSMTLTWTSRPAAPIRPGVTQVGLPTLFTVGLYDVDVTVADGADRRFTFQVRKIGYRQDRQVEVD